MSSDLNEQTPDDRSEPAGGSTNEPTVEIPQQEQELVRLKEERDHFEQLLQRALADTANIRRRQRQELDDGRRRVLEGMARELLPVLDTFALALDSYDQDAACHEQQSGTGSHVQALVDGVRMVKTLLTGALERHGLREIPAQGLDFDPARHEAVSVEPAPDEKPGTIVRVLQRGYMIGDHVVRHSKVVVAGPETDPKTKAN